jgi:nitroreductase
MDVLEAIKTRHSIRKYAKTDIPDEDIRKLLEAAMSGPSAMNARPWHFIVVRDRKLLEKIPQASPYAAMAKNAAAVIIVCGDPSLDKAPGFWVLDCSIAAQNILLAAHGLGYGAVWTGAYPMEMQAKNIQKMFNIPQGIHPIALIPIGKPDEKVVRGKEALPARIHQDMW